MIEFAIVFCMIYGFLFIMSIIATVIISIPMIVICLITLIGDMFLIDKETIAEKSEESPDTTR